MRTVFWGALAIPLLVLAACDAAAPDILDAATRAEARPASAGADGLAAARAATARYHRADRSLADGWVSPPGNPCVEAPPGGMGYHHINFGLLDGTLDPTKPEALLYEPQKNGRLRLVAVEYIVPFEDADEAPTLFGQTFEASPAAGGWALHAWIWAHNPAGMFADFNPEISCEHA